MGLGGGANAAVAAWEEYAVISHNNTLALKANMYLNAQKYIFTHKVLPAPGLATWRGP